MSLLRAFWERGSVDAQLVGNRGIRGVQLTMEDLHLEYGETVQIILEVALDHDGRLHVKEQDVSGAQWSPARLINLADILEEPHMDPRVDGFANRAADALRAFASVVSVLERVTWPDSVQVSSVIGGFRARAGTVECVGDTPLAAILALADALDAGRGDA